mgnify:CR=1 FL=1
MQKIKKMVSSTSVSSNLLAKSIFTNQHKIPERILHPLSTDEAEKYKKGVILAELKKSVNGYNGPFYRADSTENANSIIQSNSLYYSDSMNGQAKVFCWHGLSENMFVDKNQNDSKSFIIFAVKTEHLYRDKEQLDLYWEEKHKHKDEFFNIHGSAEISFEQPLQGKTGEPPKASLAIEPIACIANGKLKVFNEQLFKAMMDVEKVENLLQANQSQLDLGY